MKQIKKLKQGWKLLSIVPLAGLLTAGMGLMGVAHAGPMTINPALKSQHIGRIAPQGRPDLQVRVWVDARSVRQNANHTYNFTIRGQVKNIGSGNFVSHNNQQVLFLHEVGKSHHITEWHFTRLNRGQVKSVHVPVINQPGGEFVPAYELALTFAPDIYTDGYPANDDRNRRNNQATLSSRTLSGAFARAARGYVRPGVIHPNVIKPKPRFAPRHSSATFHKRVTLKKLIGNRLYEIRKNGTRAPAPDGTYDIGKGMLKVRGGRVYFNTVAPVKLKELKERGMAIAPMG